MLLFAEDRDVIGDETDVAVAKMSRARKAVADHANAGTHTTASATATLIV